ncbi:sulfurtransferase [Oceanobacillus saliphilus]|uniref:sulfurtransferase n=1 Tax=Oceanobacillus saliphilus TaxID=2925834 RepID=UPI00201DFA7F|nr:sulfurtransferase [Oceanobacillus saliphilus]
MSNVPLIVSTEWLAERMDDPKLRLLDATTFLKQPPEGGYYDVWSGKEAYEKGHIPGAVYADLLGELSDPDSEYKFTVPSRERFINKISELGVGDDTYVVVYDQGYAVAGAPVIASDWASRLAWQLRYEGFENVAVLDGGFPKWQEEGRPVTTDPGSYPKATFSGDRRPELLATKEDVKNALNDENVLLLNSLSEADFKGESDTYARSGHIPGSVNVFFGELSDMKTKELFDDAILREKFENVGALDPNKKVITYCGSGIAATWNALILNKLGQDNVAMYDGSMTEWAADPSLPLNKVEK